MLRIQINASRRPRERPGALGEWIPGEIASQRANAGGVLRTVPIRGLFYTAWAITFTRQPGAACEYLNKVRWQEKVNRAR